jgi:hypothetical protein
VILYAKFVVPFSGVPSLRPVISGRNGSIPCVGEIISYVCTVADHTHVWRIPSLNFVQQISRIFPTFPSSGQSDSLFTIGISADDGEFITTALTLTATVVFNQTNISCSDGRGIPGEEEKQEIITEIFGEFVLMEALFSRLYNTRIIP